MSVESPPLREDARPAFRHPLASQGSQGCISAGVSSSAPPQESGNDGDKLFKGSSMTLSPPNTVGDQPSGKQRPQWASLSDASPLSPPSAQQDDLAVPSTTNTSLSSLGQNISQHLGDGTRVHSPEEPRANVSFVEEITSVEDRMLDVLMKIYKKMEAQLEAEAGSIRSSGAQTHRGPFKRTYFGMPKQRFEQGQQLSSGNEEYEHIFPDDTYGEEVGPNARVFRVYNEEAAAHDNDMVGQSSDSSDVLLVFAGLFSAILTAFVVQTSQKLETDNMAISNSLLAEIVRLQRAQVNSTSLETIDRAITETKPSSNDLWVNGLWFTSLTLSLATALFAVLTKQWLRQYMVRTSGTIRDRSLIRQFRFAGMEIWHVVGIIGILPILLHVALSVFLAGLVTFLFPRCRPLAYVVGFMTIIVYILYVVSNLLPVIFIQCPYRTPFSEIINLMCYYTRAALPLTRTLVFRAENASRVLSQIPRGGTLVVEELPSFKNLRDKEHDHVQQDFLTANLSSDVVAWLMKTSSNPSVHSVAVQAVGGLPPSQRDKACGLLTSFLDVPLQIVSRCLVASPKLERVARVFPILNASSSTALEPVAGKFPGFVTQFRGSHDVAGTVSALSCCRLSLEGFSDMVHLIRDSPHIKLSPCTWMNVFLDPDAAKGSSEEFKLDICAKALDDPRGWDGATWDNVTSPVSLSVAFSRGPKLILSVFQEHDPFQSTDTSSGTSVPIPGSPRLRALLTLHNFLENTTSRSAVNTENDYIRLCASVWMGISSIINHNHSTNDRFAIFQVANLCLLQSPLLAEWMSSDHLFKYCETVLQACHLAVSGKPACNWRWKCLKRVADIALHVPDHNDNPFVYSAATSAQILWRDALECDAQDAYINFVSADVLRHRGHGISSLVGAFVLGIARQCKAVSWSLREPEESSQLLHCMEYLHQPNNLFSACKSLAEHKNTTGTRDGLQALARLDPFHDAWDLCWRRLRDWHPDSVEAENALEAFSKFFQGQRRHRVYLRLLKPISPSRRHPNILQSLDIEMQSISSGPRDELSTPQADSSPLPLDVQGEVGPQSHSTTAA